MAALPTSAAAAAFSMPAFAPRDLRLGPGVLGHDFGGLQLGDLVALLDSGADVDVEGLHVTRDPGIEIGRLEGGHGPDLGRLPLPVGRAGRSRRIRRGPDLGFGRVGGGRFRRGFLGDGRRRVGRRLGRPRERCEHPGGGEQQDRQQGGGRFQLGEEHGAEDSLHEGGDRGRDPRRPAGREPGRGTDRLVHQRSGHRRLGPTGRDSRGERGRGQAAAGQPVAQPRPRPHQPHPDRAGRQPQPDRRFLLRQALEVAQHDRNPVALGQPIDLLQDLRHRTGRSVGRRGHRHRDDRLARGLVRRPSFAAGRPPGPRRAAPRRITSSRPNPPCGSSRPSSPGRGRSPGRHPRRRRRHAARPGRRSTIGPCRSTSARNAASAASSPRSR